MNATLVEQRIDQIIGKIRQYYNPQKIMLYGSLCSRRTH